MRAITQQFTNILDVHIGETFGWLLAIISMMGFHLQHVIFKLESKFLVDNLVDDGL